MNICLMFVRTILSVEKQLYLAGKLQGWRWHVPLKLRHCFLTPFFPHEVFILLNQCENSFSLMGQIWTEFRMMVDKSQKFCQFIKVIRAGPMCITTWNVEGTLHNPIGILRNSKCPHFVRNAFFVALAGSNSTCQNLDAKSRSWNHKLFWRLICGPFLL